MRKPRIRLFALGGTIAARPGKRGMKVGLGADDLLRAVPDLDAIADIRAETVSRSPSSDLLLDDLYALAARIQAMADAGESDVVVVTQGTNTLEETAFLFDLVLRVDILRGNDRSDAQSKTHFTRWPGQRSRSGACRGCPLDKGQRRRGLGGDARPGLGCC